LEVFFWLNGLWQEKAVATDVKSIS